MPIKTIIKRTELTNQNNALAQRCRAPFRFNKPHYIIRKLQTPHRKVFMVKKITTLLCKSLLLICLSVSVAYGMYNNSYIPSIISYLLADDFFVATYENLDDPTNAHKTALIVNDIDLNYFDFRIADGVTLHAQGGVIRNGVIQNLHNITGDKVTLFDTNVSFDQVYSGQFYTEWYGAKGDGINDDSDAFNTSFENASNIRLCENTTYNINSQVTANRIGTLAIDGNSATIVSRQNVDLNNLGYNIFVFEATLSSVSINDLTFDGENKIGRAFYLKTGFNFNNVAVKNLLEARTTAYAFRVDVHKQLIPALFKDNQCDTIDGVGNGAIGDGAGAARCFYINWKYAAQPTTIEIDGGSFKNVWGDDGDVIQLAQVINDYYHGNKLIVRDAYLGHASRRLIKGTSSGIELYNNYFESADTNNPKVATTTSAGMITFSIFNDPATPNARNINSKAMNNTFDGSGGYDGRVILFKTGQADISNNVFIDSNIVFSKAVGNVEIQENTFQGSAKISIGDTVSEGVVNIVNNVVSRLEGSTGTYRGWVVQDKTEASTDNLNIIDNVLNIYSSPNENVFGLIYFVRGTTSNLTINNNTINRSGTMQKSQMLLVDIPLDDTSKITNNHMDSSVFSSTRGMDLRQIQNPPPTVTNNTHSSGQSYPDL